MHLNRQKFQLCILLTALLSSLPCYAQSVLVTDCQGFTRALQKVKGDSLSKLEINVSDALGNPAENVQVTLTNSATGQTSTALSKSGVAVFENVTPGAFSVATSAPGMTLASVSVAPLGLSTVAATGVVAGTTAVGGTAATGVVVATTDVVDQVAGNNDEPEPTPTPIPPTPTPEPTPQPTPPPPSGCNNCDPDALPTPVDDNDFFNNSSAARQLSPFS